MALDLRTKFYLFLFLAVMAAGVIIWLDWKILFKNIVSTSNQTVAFRKEIEYLRTRMQYLPFIKNEARRVALQRQNLKVFHSFGSPLEFLYFLEGAARDSGNLIQVSVKEGSNPAFAVRLSGSFNSLLDFLMRLGITPAQIQLQQMVKATSLDASTSLHTELTITPFLIQ